MHGLGRIRRQNEKTPKKQEIKKPIKITVWDYTDAMSGRSAPNDDFEPVSYEVEAWCVGGEDGIRAYFFIEDTFCEADGDDGHWWLKSRCHDAWLKEIKEVINSVKR